MLLFLIRHAEAEQGDPDELRRLTPDGREVARRLGEQLAGERLDAVLSSPLLRARETAQPIAQASGVETEIDERLAPGATADSVLAAIAGRGETVAVVGHQPDCSAIAETLTGHDPGFPAGGVARLELAG